MLSVTKLNVAGIASIILLIAYSAVGFAQIMFVRGGSRLEICGHVVNMLFFTDLAIIIFLHKLGLQQSRYHVNACWAALALWAAFVPMTVVLAYRRSDSLSLVVYGMFLPILTVATAFCTKVVVAAPSFSGHFSSSAQGQQPFLPFDFPGTFIWFVFGFVLVALFLSVLTTFADDTTELVTLSAINSIILALLAGSTWIVATTPLIADGVLKPNAPQEQDTAAITEPLAPQEDPAAKTNERDVA